VVHWLLACPLPCGRVQGDRGGRAAVGSPASDERKQVRDAILVTMEFDRDTSTCSRGNTQFTSSPRLGSTEQQNEHPLRSDL